MAVAVAAEAGFLGCRLSLAAVGVAYVEWGPQRGVLRLKVERPPLLPRASQPGSERDERFPEDHVAFEFLPFPISTSDPAPIPGKWKPPSLHNPFVNTLPTAVKGNKQNSDHCLGTEDYRTSLDHYLAHGPAQHMRLLAHLTYCIK